MKQSRQTMTLKMALASVSLVAGVALVALVQSNSVASRTPASEPEQALSPGKRLFKKLDEPRNAQELSKPSVKETASRIRDKVSRAASSIKDSSEVKRRSLKDRIREVRSKIEDRVKTASNDVKASWTRFKDDLKGQSDQVQNELQNTFDKIPSDLNYLIVKRANGSKYVVVRNPKTDEICAYDPETLKQIETPTMSEATIAKLKSSSTHKSWVSFFEQMKEIVRERQDDLNLELDELEEKTLEVVDQLADLFTEKAGVKVKEVDDNVIEETDLKSGH